MLQFDKSQTTNKNAVYIETFNSESGYYDNLKAVYSQSYDQSSGSFTITATSTPTQYRHWMVFTNLGVDLPSPSGQYDIEIYRRGEDTEGRWGFTNEVWDTSDQRWATFGEGGLIGSAIYTDRAYIVGSNESSITQYLSPDENGSYITYNG